MNRVRYIWRWLCTLGQRREVKQEIDEELRFHLQQRTAENIAAGMSPEEAAREARRRFGNLQNVREECRDVRGAGFGETILQDMHFGLRMLRKHSGVTAVAVIMLGTGIGANTALFSVIEAVLLRSLPYPEANKIVQVWSKQNSVGNLRLSPSLPDVADFKAQARSFASLAHYGLADFHFTGTGEPAEVRAVRVSTEFFDVLGVPPFLGRVFLSDEGNPGKDRVVVLSYGLWQQRFGGDTNMLGRTIGLDGNSYVICGVMPRNFHFPEQAQIWAPYGMRSEGVYWALQRATHFDKVIGRLRRGATLPQAQAELDGIAARLEKEYPKTNEGLGVRVIPLEKELVGDVKPALLLLLSAVGAILLIACINTANLQITRGLKRQRELAVRSALGAGRGRIIRQLLVESLLLSTAGGAVGLGMAYCSIHTLIALAPANIPRFEESRLDGTVLLACLCLSFLTGILSGLLPAIQAARLAIADRLKDGSGATDGRQRHFARNALVTSQIAVAVVLLISAGLLVKSFEKLSRVPLGFDPHDLLMTRVTLPWMKYHIVGGGKWDLSGKDKLFFGQLFERIRMIPGAEHSALAFAPPIAENPFRLWAKRTGENVPPGKELTTEFNFVTPSYFDVVRIPLLRGRNLNDQDTSNSPRVAVVDESFARRYFPDEDPLGRQLLVEGQGNKPFTVVGIAGGVRHRNLAEPPYPHLYLHYQQINDAKMWLVVRGGSGLKGLDKAVAREVQALDPDQSIGPLQTMEDHLTASTQLARFRTFLLGLFAALAFTLSVVGIYSVMAHSVTQRTRELGLRAALGASRGDILKLIIGQGGKLAGAGVLLGVVIALGATRMLAGMLFEVTPTDPVPLMLIPGLLFAAALLASYVPARRATRVDPMTALRYE